MRFASLFVVFVCLLIGARAFAEEFTCYEKGLEMGPMMQKILIESGNGLHIQIADRQLISFKVRMVNGVDFSGQLICLDYSKVETLEGTVEALSGWRSIHGYNFKIVFHGSSATMKIGELKTIEFKLCRTRKPPFGACH